MARVGQGTFFRWFTAAALASAALSAAAPVAAAPICEGETFPGTSPTTFMSTGHITKGSELDVVTSFGVSVTSLQPVAPVTAGQPNCLLPGRCIPTFMIWDDFDGDGFDELLVAYTEFAMFTAPASQTELLLYDGLPKKTLLGLDTPPFLVKTIPGAINGMTSGDFDGDGDAELAVIKAGDTTFPWGVGVLDVPNGTVLASRAYALAPTAVTIGDLFPATPGKEVIVGIGNTIDALSNAGTPLAAPFALEGSLFGGKVQALAFGDFSGEAGSLAIGRATSSQDETKDTDWKVGTLGFNTTTGTLAMRHRFAFDYIPNICCNTDQWHELAQQPTHVALGDINTDGKNELIAILHTPAAVSTKPSEGNPGTYIIGYSTIMPRNPGGEPYEKQFKDEIFRLRDGISQITGIDLRDITGDGNADLAVSLLRPNPASSLPTALLYDKLKEIAAFCFDTSSGNVTCAGAPSPKVIGNDTGPLPDPNPDHIGLDIWFPLRGSTSVALTTKAAKTETEPLAPTRCGNCGDGEVQDNEDCDDGNSASNDGCSATCKTEACGDGIKQSSETCDDGNFTASDGCELCQTCPAFSTPNIVTFVVDLADDDATPGSPTTAEKAYCVPSPGELDPNAPPCNLRGVLRRAESLWSQNYHTQVVVLLEHTTHKLKATLTITGGDLTISGLPSAAGELPPNEVQSVSIVRDPATTSEFGLFETSQFRPCAPTILRLHNVSLKDGDNEQFGFRGGGAIRAANTTIIANNTIFSHNEANQPGAAIYATESVLTITKCLFDGNKNTQAPETVGNGCTSAGGGLYLDHCDATVDRSSFVRNYAGKGGAIAETDSKLVVRNSTLSTNTAAIHGAAIVMRGGTIGLYFNTITLNFAAGGMTSADNPILGAVASVGRACGAGATPADITATGNIIAKNDLNNGANPDCAMTPQTVTHSFLNLVGAGDVECNGKLGDPETSALVGTRVSELNPRLGPLTNHAGGAVGVGNLAHDLLIAGVNGETVSSPALGQFPPQCSASPCNEPAETDQRSFIRAPFELRDLGSIEMGAGDDTDGDRMMSSVDPAPQTASRDFNTFAAGGSTEGSILDYGNVPFYVSLDPATLGVNINMSLGTTSAPAKFAACAQRVQLSMSAGQDARLECAAALVRTPGQTVALSPPAGFALCSGCLTGTLITPAGVSSSVSPGQSIALGEGKTSVEWRSVQAPLTRIYEQSVNACNAMQIRPLAATASSQESSTFAASKAIDGSPSTRWSSLFSDPQWLALDFGRTRHFTEIAIDWENAASAKYDIQVSNDGLTWTNVFTDNNGNGGTDVIPLDASGSRLRVFSRARRTTFGNSILEIRVKGTALCAEDADALVVYSDALTRGAGTYVLTGDGQQQFTTVNLASPTAHLGAQAIEVKTTQNASSGTHWKLMLFANGNSPSTAGIDVHEFNRLEFWAKTSRAAGVTLKGAFGTSEDSGTKTFPAMALTTTWQKFTLDLTGVNLADVNALLWVYLHKDANAFSFTGISVFVDDVRLIR